MKSLPVVSMAALGFCYAATVANAAVVAYADEAAFLSALAALGPVAHEGFENATVWGGVRSDTGSGFATAETVSSLGITWQANNTSSEVTTSSGAARSGEWGLFSYQHGSYLNPEPGTDCTIPGDCGDGFMATPQAGVLYGIGGWVRTNTPFAKIGLFLGGYPSNPVDFGESCDASGENCVDNAVIGTAYKFFGVIDSGGFSEFEYRELEGTVGDAKYIFADDFSFAGSAIAAVPLPSAAWLFGAGILGLTGFGRPSRRRSGSAGGQRDSCRQDQ